MKHPFLESPFPAVHLTQQECIEFRDTAYALVDECLAEFDEYVDVQNRTINKRKWKEIKELESVAVYKKMTKEELRQARTAPVQSASMSSTGSSVSSASVRDSSSSSSSSAPSLALTQDWPVPRMICVGKVVGSLDDIMYGIVTPDNEAMRVNTSYLEDEAIDWRVLCQMQIPSNNRPFQYLGIKWTVRNQTPSPRDYVYLEATGVKTTKEGERYGYWVQHSVDIQAFSELRHLAIARARQSWTSVFRETAHGSVEIYMRMFTDQGRNVSERVAVQAAASTMLTIWKVPLCAQDKKLAWLMRDSSAKRSPQTLAKARADKSKVCTLCLKSAGAFSTVSTCELCLCKMCSRCSSARQLSYIRPNGQVFKVPTGFCKNCITRAAKTSSADVSLIEYVPGNESREPAIIEPEVGRTMPRRHDSTVLAKKQVSGPPAVASTPVATATPVVIAKTVSPQAVPAPRVLDAFHDSGRRAPIYLSTPDENARFQTPPRPVTLDLVDVPQAVRIVPANDNGLPPPASAQFATSYDHHVTLDEHRRKLWLQMNQLRLQAEEAYWQTKQNELSMRGVQGP